MSARTCLRASTILLVAVALATACVPVGEEQDPRGALGVATVPSSGSRGEPFVTEDGWTVQVEQLVVQVSMSGTAREPASSGAENPYRSSMQGTYLFKASQPVEFVFPGLEEGPGEVTIFFTERVVELSGPEQSEARAYYAEGVRGVEPELASRFDLPAESEDPLPTLDDPRTPDFDESARERDYIAGPSIVLVARGEKGGRVVRINFAFVGTFGGSSSPGVIRANALSTLRFEVAAEGLFTTTSSSSVVLPEGRLVFDDLAAADVDGDGLLSAAELRAVRLLCDDCTEEEKARAESDSGGSSPAAVLQTRSQRIFRPLP